MCHPDKRSYRVYPSSHLIPDNGDSNKKFLVIKGAAKIKTHGLGQHLKQRRKLGHSSCLSEGPACHLFGGWVTRSGTQKVLKWSSREKEEDRRHPPHSPTVLCPSVQTESLREPYVTVVPPRILTYIDLDWFGTRSQSLVTEYSCKRAKEEVFLHRKGKHNH